jgi:FkbM family methyltransferase
MIVILTVLILALIFLFIYKFCKSDKFIVYDKNFNKIDNKNYEFIEQELLKKYLIKNDHVLQLGGNIGTSCITVDKIINNKKMNVCVESNTNLIHILEYNKKINNCNFKIINNIISEKPSKLYISNDTNGISSSSYFRKNTHSNYQNVNNLSLYNLNNDYKFTVLFADYKGCINDFITEYGDYFLKYLRLIIIKKDYFKEVNYNKIKQKILNSNFILAYDENNMFVFISKTFYVIKNLNYLIKKQIKYLDNEIFNKFVDKLLFKKYCQSKGIKTLNTIKIFNNLNEIDFNKLPKSFILKSNKGSGRNIIVKNDICIYPYKGKTFHQNHEKFKNYISKWSDPYNPKTEPFYEYTKPLIFLEEFIENIPNDIKIFVYNNKVQIIWIFNDRFLVNNTLNFYNNKFIKLNYVSSEEKTTNNNDSIIDEIISDNIQNKIIDIAEDISRDIPLNIIRVDLYYINKNIYGSEITLVSDAGNNIINL